MARGKKTVGAGGHGKEFRNELRDSEAKAWKDGAKMKKMTHKERRSAKTLNPNVISLISFNPLKETSFEMGLTPCCCL